MAMDEKGLGERVQTARRNAGFTQQQLCHQAGLSYSTLAKIERGAIKAPSIFTIKSISEALNISLNSLLGIESDTPTQAAEPLSPAPKPKMTAQSGVRFVYFDINGCLVRFFHAAFTRLAHDHHLSPDEVETVFWHYNDEVCRGEMTMEQFNVALADRLGVKDIDWQAYYMAAVEPIAEMQELVAWAAERYHVGLLSNIMPGFIEHMRRQKLLPDIDYDVIIDSSVVGAIKPERRIYEVATEKAQVKPDEILAIDDDPANLMAAERLGWRVLRFDAYRSHEMAARIKDSLKPAQ